MDAFVSMQSVRGMRLRRVIEVITDYSVKLLNQDKLSEHEIREYDFVPHPNDHLRMFGNIAERAEDSLKRRPLSLIRLDQQLLIIGDEPVLVANDLSESKQRRLAGPTTDMGARAAIERFGGGFADAEAILLAVSPSVAMLYGPPGPRRIPFELHFTEREAASFAAEHNELVIAGAIDWVAANPDNVAFASMKMPQPRPLLTVHDNGSAAADRVNTTAARRPIRRLRPDDVPIASDPIVAGSGRRNSDPTVQTTTSNPRFRPAERREDIH